MSPYYILRVNTWGALRSIDRPPRGVYRVLYGTGWGTTGIEGQVSKIDIPSKFVYAYQYIQTQTKKSQSLDVPLHTERHASDHPDGRGQSF